MASATASLSSLSISSATTTHRLSLLPPKSTSFLPKPSPKPKFKFSPIRASSSGEEFSLPLPEFDSGDEFNPFEEPPEGYVEPPAFDEEPMETEDEIAAAYEEIYGPAFSGVSLLGNDIKVLDARLEKKTRWGGTEVIRERFTDEFEERVIQLRRVTKVTKGGKNMQFRAVVVVGNRKGYVGVGVGKAIEIPDAMYKATVNARRNIVKVPLTKGNGFPHKSEAYYGAAKVMLRPTKPGDGLAAGGAVRVVLQMAGYENGRGKQLNSTNTLNNARATIVALQQMRTFDEVAEERGIPKEIMWQ